MEVISIIIVVLLIVVIIYCTKVYNNLVTLKHAVSKAWVNIEQSLKQRHDQLPKLIESCKQFGINQPDLFEKILATRTQVMNAQQMGEVQSLASAEQRLQKESNKLLKIANAHSELSADKNYLAIASSLKDFELSIADRTELYNRCVSASNERIEQFPESFIASFFSFGVYDLLEFQSGNERNLEPED